MAKDLVAKGSTLPAHLQKAVTAAREVAKEFTGGVQSGFPVLSYRGKTWRVKKGGEEQVYTNEDGDAVQAISLTLIRSGETLAKTYYKGKYTEGSNEKPSCWSANGTKPDPNVPEPVARSCQGCPMNAWGSRISDDGRKQKACQDVRRMAVIMDHELEAIASGDKDPEDATVLLLRVPAGSLNPLKEYVEKVLLPKGGLLPYMVITRVGFDTDAAYPKFTFKATRLLDGDEYSTVEVLRESDIVKRIINEAAELDDEGIPDDDTDAPSTDHAEKGEGLKSAPSKSSEEDMFSEPDDDDDEIPMPPPAKKSKKRAAQVEEDSIDDDDEEEVPALPAKKKKAVKPKKAAAPESEDDESPVAEDDDVDAMLDSILG